MAIPEVLIADDSSWNRAQIDFSGAVRPNSPALVEAAERLKPDVIVAEISTLC